MTRVQIVYLTALNYKDEKKLAHPCVKDKKFLFSDKLIMNHVQAICFP